MALSNQDLFVYLLLGSKGYYVDIGSGNGTGEPCASNTSWLEEIGWTGLLIDINKDYIQESRKTRPNSISIAADALNVSYKEIFQHFSVPKIIDYLSIDLDVTNRPAPCVEVLALFPFDEYDFKILTIEHDLYNPWGLRQKQVLQAFMADKKYKLVCENVALVYDGTKCLEDWYINADFDFKLDIKNKYYLCENPNNIVIDLMKR